jgi:TRAP-type C4-dicarboxylate transport system permease small subunit
MTNSRRAIFSVIGILIAVITAWFSWMSFTQSRTAWMKTKVKQALSTNIQRLSPQWPRVETHTNLTDQVYYSIIVNNPIQTFELTRHVLESLNQDVSVPPFKMTQISMSYEYGSSEDTLISQANVQFPLVFGIEKELMVQSAIKVPHYTTLK